MDLSDWKPEYSVGNAILDSQHKKLLALCKRVGNYDAEIDAANFHLILNELAEYADTHFKTEEYILGAVGYSELNEQKDEHEAYIERLTDFLYRATMGRLYRHALSEYLECWWIDHILQSDMKYKTFLKQEEPAIAPQ